MILNRYGALSPLLIGVAVRQAASRTGRLHAELSRPIADDRPHPTWRTALTSGSARSAAALLR